MRVFRSVLLATNTPADKPFVRFRTPEEYRLDVGGNLAC